MKQVLPASSDGYQSHALHAPERIWPETNCYIDLWIEVLASAGTDPLAMLGFTLTQDFEGDQFTFFKVPLEDLETLYDIKVTELAIFDRVEDHVETQIGRGRLCLVEMDSFYLPDTRGTGYREKHGKTTVGINRLDRTGKTMAYFHNGGYFQLGGDDYPGIFQHEAKADALPFLPYTEFVKFPDHLPVPQSLRPKAAGLLARHFARGPAANPIAAFAEVFPAQVEHLTQRPFDHFHLYAFNTLRQLGANFELLASHLAWLEPEGRFDSARAEALRIAEIAKSVQFQLARAVTRKNVAPLRTVLDPAVASWDRLMAGLGAQIG